jgi:hypothetical protein
VERKTRLSVLSHVGLVTFEVVTKELFHKPIGGSKPEPQKVPSPQLQPGHERVQVDHLAAALEGVVPVQQDVPPGRR